MIWEIIPADGTGFQRSWLTTADMWSQIPWMKPVHMAILGLLSPPKRLTLTPSNIARNIEYSDGYVADECRVLVEHQLLTVERDGDPFYSVTEIGERLASGKIGAEELKEAETEVNQ